MFLFQLPAVAQDPSGPAPQTGLIRGYALDINGDPIPRATVALESGTGHRTVVADEQGHFVINDVLPAVAFHVAVSFNGFSTWTSPEIDLTPGQQFDLPEIKLKLAAVDTAVAAVFSETLALEQVHAEEEQRIFGFVPNFYTVYEKDAQPLPAKLKFQLATRASTDVVTIGATIFIAGIRQASDTPGYVQGMKGFGQRVGASYADTVSNVYLGGAILPALLHQDPRYFYQGEGTKKSRALHALSTPFICRGDNGKKQFNFSSIGGDLMSGALSNAYYPDVDKGATLVWSTALIGAAARTANAFAQEFLLSRFTNKPKTKD